MAIIGIFRKQDNGGFEGHFDTLTFSRNVVFVPLEKKSGKSPDFRITFGVTEMGVAWKHQGDNGEYLFVKLDDPVLPAPVSCRLVKPGTENTYALIWERERKRN